MVRGSASGRFSEDDKDKQKRGVNRNPYRRASFVSWRRARARTRRAIGHSAPAGLGPRPILWYVATATDREQPRMVVPRILRATLLRAFHDDKTAGHLGVFKTYGRLRPRRSSTLTKARRAGPAVQDPPCRTRRAGSVAQGPPSMARLCTFYWLIMLTGGCGCSCLQGLRHHQGAPRARCTLGRDAGS